MTSDELISRARERCSRHRPGKALGVCDRCIVETMEEMLVEEGMARGDAFDLAQEWALAGDRPDH